MKKITFLLICSLFLFSCEYSTKNPEKVEENKKIETNSGKVEEKILTEKEKKLGDCDNMFYTDAFIFLYENTCYAMWYYSEMQPISYFYLYSEKELLKDWEENLDHKWDKKYKNLLNKNLLQDTPKYLENISFIRNYYVYPDMIKHIAKTLKELWVDYLNWKYIYNNTLTNEDIKDRIETEIIPLNKKFWNKIDISALENLNPENLYKDVKKELEIF